MTEIKLNEKLENASSIYLVEKIEDLPANTCSSKELDYITGKLKENFDYAIVNQYDERIVVVKVAKENTYQNVEKVRKAGAKILSELNGAKVANVHVFGNEASSLAMAEGMALANYQFLKYFKDADKKQNALAAISLISDSIGAQKVLELVAGIEANSWAKDLVNEPLSFLTATELANQIVEKTTPVGVKVEVLDQLKIETLKMGGLLAVNQGSLDPATFTIMEWKPENARNVKPIVLVGKGIVYDTGGLSLKPTANSMDFMKSDMGGAAAMAGAIYAVAKAKIPVHVVGLIPATDNRPSGNAYAPGDVINMYNGLTVEVLNTDAEGRMVMADALSYAKKYEPELVIDAATLTGAAVAALGPEASAIMGTADESVMSALKTAGVDTYERVVEFPFFEEYGEYLKSDIADLKNIGGPLAGTITAGKFLENFTDYPWVHVDIAPTAWSKATKGYTSKGATASGVRLFFEFIKNYTK
ncbi:MAG: leucyl aminopeptidase [Flavobacteriales bacterium]|jgi:leucyl aminopeptidase|nr:leucyl aminopeptidase [Flavobacteriales bacterium]